MSRPYDYLFKLLLVGDSGVGKTSMLTRYVDNTFNISFISTIGIDFKIKTLDIDGKKVKLQIWDTAGQERFRTITTAYFRGAMGIILMYDVTNQKSFDDIQVWVQNIRSVSDDNIKLIIGNKCDLDDMRIISKTQGEELAKKYEALFFEVSVKNNINIDCAIISLSKEIKKKVERNMPVKESPISSKNLLVEFHPVEKKKSFCALL